MYYYSVQGEYDQVLDVLKTGIRSKPGSIGTSRLYLVEAELRSGRGEWVRLYIYREREREGEM